MENKESSYAMSFSSNFKHLVCSLIKDYLSIVFCTNLSSLFSEIDHTEFLMSQ